MKVTTKLAPFWHTIEDENTGTENDPVKCRLRPLTQPQIMELFETFRDEGEKSVPTQQTWYRAGCMGLDGAGKFENLEIDGKLARWPIDRDKVPYKIICACGLRLCMDAWGEDAEEREKN